MTRELEDEISHQLEHNIIMTLEESLYRAVERAVGNMGRMASSGTPLAERSTIDNENHEGRGNSARLR